MIVNHLSRLMGERRTNMVKVARETGIARSTLSEFYHGTLQRYDAKTLDRLCAYFKVGVGDILEYREEETGR